MKRLGCDILFLLFFLLFSTHLFANYEKEIASINKLIPFAEKISSKNVSYLKNALVFYQDGDEDNGLHQVYLFIQNEGLQTSHSPVQFLDELTKLGQSIPDYLFNSIDRTNKSDDFLFAFYAYLYPDLLIEIISNYIGGLVSATVEVEKIFDSNLTTLERLGESKNQRIRDAIRGVRDSLADVKMFINSKGKTNPQALLSFLKSTEYFEHILTQFFHSTLSWYDTAELRGEEIATILQNYITNKKFTIDNSGQFEFLNSECNIEVKRIYINRQNVTSSAVAIGLVSFGVLAVVSGGTSLAVTPAFISALEFTSASSSLVLASNIALNITDRYNVGGIKGLLNVRTLFDVLMLFLCALPNSSSFSKNLSKEMVKGGKIATKVIGWQYQTGYIISALGFTYGGWMALRADAISYDLAGKGINISPNEIRKQGLVYMAIGFMGGLSSYQMYKNGLSKYGVSYRKSIQEYRIMSNIPKVLAKYKDRILPHVQVREAVKGIKMIHSGLYAGGIMKVGQASAFLAVQALEYAVLGLAANSMPEFWYLDKSAMKDVKLSSNETAVTLVGFEESDILYQTAHSTYANRREIEQFGRFYHYDYNSPDDFLEQLISHSRRFGKIKYLKVQTHGLPGLLFTAAQEGVEGSSGNTVFISSDWIRKNKERIKEISKEAFAPNAKIIFLSCLVGANLDKEIDASGVHLNKEMGDEFLNLFGESFLVNGGTIRSSTRIILMTSTYGATLSRLSMSIFEDDKERASFFSDVDKLMINISVLNGEIRDGLQKNPDLFIPSIMDLGIDLTDDGEIGQNQSSNSNQVKSPEVVKALLYRIWSIYKNLPQIYYKYCFNIEGNFFSERIKETSFVAH